MEKKRDDLLGRLYREWVRPAAASGAKPPQAQEQRLHALREQLLDDLDGERSAHFLELESLQRGLGAPGEEEVFARGFRMGARMMLEVLL